MQMPGAVTHCVPCRRPDRHFRIHRLAVFVLLLLCCCPAAHAVENPPVNVSVTGVEGEIHKNVLAHLSIARQKDNPRLTDYLVRRLARKAEGEVKKALQPYGYYHPEVRVDLVRQEDAWQVNIGIAPGRPVTVGTLVIELSGPGRQDAELVDAVTLFPLWEGDILAHQLYENGKRDLIAEANGAGYLDAAFTRHRILVNREQRTAEIILDLDTGPRYLFGETTFTADFLSHDLLVKMLPYSKGDPFSSRKLVRLRQSLYNSGYFSSVDVASGEAGEDSHSIPVEVVLTPRNSNVWGLGIGYGTDTGVRGTAEWNNRLLNRHGHQFRLTMQPSERKSYYGGVYTIPVRNPLRDRIALLAKWEKEDFENTETEQRSASVSYDHIGEKGEYSLYFKFLDEDFDSGGDTGHATLFIPGLKTTYRLADDRLVTRRGIRATINLSGAHRELLSDASYVQGSLAAKGIYALVSGWRAIGRFQLGGTLVDEFFELPPSLRFYAGGDQSVRGYAYKSIGPRDAFGNIIGGRFLLAWSAELEKKLSERWSAAVFVDSGDAPDNLTELAMKTGAGIGLRWNAPFGQIRLDLASAVSEGADSWRIHFNVGADL
jgi:translocation and assembly module TamA